MQSTNELAYFMIPGGEAWPETMEKRRKIFIVEDNEMHSMMMDYVLTKENFYNIYKFKSGEECLNKLSIHPDIIILDYGLPGMDGFQTFEYIKRSNPEIPVVVVTENRSSHIAKQFLDAGAYEYIFKEQNAFGELTKVIDNAFIYMANKEYEKKNRTTLMIVGIFALLILVSSIISYILLRR